MIYKLISIIVPNYNKSDFISETITAVLAQTYINWELLIVDDNSTDNSWQIIKGYAKKDQRINAFENNSGRKGGSVCRNIGLKRAKGEFVIFLDSDDFLVKTCLEKRLVEFHINMEADFIVFPMGTFYYKIGDCSSKWIPDRNNHLQKFLMHMLPWQTMQPIWKRKILEKIDGFDEAFPRLQDVEIHTRVLLEDDVNYMVSKSRTPDCYYRISEERKIAHPSLFYSQWVDAVELYITKTIHILNFGGFNKNKHFLKGTLIRGITTLLNAKKNGEIDEEDSKQLINRLFDFSKKKFNQVLYLKIYVKLYNKGFYRIKGFNFIFQNIIIITK